jgi:protein TonB
MKPTRGGYLMIYKDTDRNIEKTFLYLLALSLLLHVAMFMVINLFPPEKKVAKEEPIMIDLQDLPPRKEMLAKEKKEVKRFAEEKRRVAKEIAPKGEMERNSNAAMPQQVVPRAFPPQRRGQEIAPAQPAREKTPFREAPGENLLKPREDRLPSLAKLFPTPGRMAGLEENYRKKYSKEVEEGETKFLDTDDIQFGSFLRRFETAVYGVWSYPQEAARLGIEGITPVRITFNRKGEIEHIEVLKSSGSYILDNEVLRTLHNIGPVGSLPKGYTKDKFYLIAFFKYGIKRGMSRTLD